MFDYQSSEYAAIGCMLIDERSIPMVREELTSSEPFQSDNCRRAFDIICSLANSSKPVDPITVGQASGLDNQFLADCMDMAPSCSAASEYAKTVKEGFRRRQLREIGDKMQEDAFSHDVDSNQLLEEARTALDNLAKDVGTCSVKSPFDSLQDFLQFRADVNEGKRQTMKVL